MAVQAKAAPKPRRRRSDRVTCAELLRERYVFTHLRLAIKDLRAAHLHGTAALAQTLLDSVRSGLVMNDMLRIADQMDSTYAVAVSVLADLGVAMWVREWDAILGRMAKTQPDELPTERRQREADLKKLRTGAVRSAARIAKKAANAK